MAAAVWVCAMCASGVDVRLGFSKQKSNNTHTLYSITMKFTSSALLLVLLVRAPSAFLRPAAVRQRQPTLAFNRKPGVASDDEMDMWLTSNKEKDIVVCRALPFPARAHLTC